MIVPLPAVTPDSDRQTLIAAGYPPWLRSEPAAASELSWNFALAKASKLSLPDEIRPRTGHQPESSSTKQEGANKSGAWNFGAGRLRQFIKSAVPSLHGYMVFLRS